MRLRMYRPRTFFLESNVSCLGRNIIAPTILFQERIFFKVFPFYILYEEERAVSSPLRDKMYCASHFQRHTIGKYNSLYSLKKDKRFLFRDRSTRLYRIDGSN